jgi:dUTP pyrophosphatase
MTAHASGMDVRAAVMESTRILPGEWMKIPTGIAVSLPHGYEAQIRPRSGLAVEHGVTVLNAPGTIDADYRGEIAIVLINHGKKPFPVNRGDRIAQMVIQSVCRVDWEENHMLDVTARGEGGFGHTRSA